MFMLSMIIVIIVVVVVVAAVVVVAGLRQWQILLMVVLDFMSQVQSHLMSHQYDSVMKKANLQSYGRGSR